MLNKKEQISAAGKLNLQYIIGMKLRNFRREKGLGLKQLSSLTGLSASYINEIEKGKKYPKAEKIMLLAEGLGVNYDDLVSISMTGRLGQMSELFFSSSVLGSFPFQFFWDHIRKCDGTFHSITQESGCTYHHVNGNFKSV